MTTEHVLLDLDQLQTVSITRARRWHEGTDWTTLEWAGAMCGEAGEAANVAKKIRRWEQGLGGNRPNEDIDTLQEKLARELADTVCYSVLVAHSQGINLAYWVRRVFNEKSEQVGFPERI